MTPREASLFFISVLIWGSTWLAIKFQLGTIHPAVSVGYRFLLSGLVLAAFCRFILKRSLKLTKSQHILVAMQSLFLFCLNYLALYYAEQWLTSGVVAVIFSLMVVFNGLGAYRIYREKLHPRFWIGAGFGIVGIVFIFSSELKGFRLSGNQAFATLLALLGTLSASFGNLISKKIYQQGVDVIPATAIGMIYGSIIVLVGCAFFQVPFHFELSQNYILSLLYLSVFGSIVAFISYLTLLKSIGPARAGYLSVMTPVVALTLSSLFEGMLWSAQIVAGIILCVVGNLLILQKSVK
jgi:drug/metabolite transporter (DMT)-like permease